MIYHFVLFGNLYYIAHSIKGYVLNHLKAIYLDLVPKLLPLIPNPHLF